MFKARTLDFGRIWLTPGAGAQGSVIRYRHHRFLACSRHARVLSVRLSRISLVRLSCDFPFLLPDDMLMLISKAFAAKASEQEKYPRRTGT